ncbi:MAG TPA: hypothetical protein DCQ30_10455, partial [Acidimicrobiaceae bacterium]|nr:hypothetical protein [Acidimicrobiaceae bacterium]
MLPRHPGGGAGHHLRELHVLRLRPGVPRHARPPVGRQAGCARPGARGRPARRGGGRAFVGVAGAHSAAGSAPGRGVNAVSGQLPDAEARRRVAEDLGHSLVVVAGAGTGKTTALVSRVVALVR